MRVRGIKAWSWPGAPEQYVTVRVYEPDFDFGINRAWNEYVDFRCGCGLSTGSPRQAFFCSPEHRDEVWRLVGERGKPVGDKLTWLEL